MKRILLLPILFFLLSINTSAQKATVLNQNQAVAIAEKFVAENGYTKTTPNRKRMVLEAGEKFSELDKIIASRSNLIEPRAPIAFIKDVNGQKVWSVQFLFWEQDYKKQKKPEQRGDLKLLVTYDFGREVRMSLDGTKVWMERNPLAVQEANIYGDCTGEDEKIQPAKKP